MDYPVLYHENQKVGSFIAELLNHGNEILQTQKQELKNPTNHRLSSISHENKNELENFMIELFKLKLGNLILGS